MTHRPQSLDECAPTLLHHPISMSLRKQGADGVYGLSDKKKKNRRINEWMLVVVLGGGVGWDELLAQLPACAHGRQVHHLLPKCSA